MAQAHVSMQPLPIGREDHRAPVRARPTPQRSVCARRWHPTTPLRVLRLSPWLRPVVPATCARTFPALPRASPNLLSPVPDPTMRGRAVVQDHLPGGSSPRRAGAPPLTATSIHRALAVPWKVPVGYVRRVRLLR